MTATFFERLIVHGRGHLQNLRLRISVAGLTARNILSKESLVARSGPVVSMTTYGDRYETVFLALETICRGTVRPSRLILWLDDPSRFSNLPGTLQRLQKRGLEIRLCENFGPHTKYYPYLEAETQFTDPLVTADDDVLYPKTWLHGLVEAYQSNDQVINCYCARTLQLAGHELAPYATWPLCTSTQPSLRNFVTGVSGVIYPPRFLEFVKAADRGFLNVCPNNDDLWLHVHAVRLGCKVRQIENEAHAFPPIPGTQASALYHTNMFGGANDEQISKTYSSSDVRALANES